MNSEELQISDGMVFMLKNQKTLAFAKLKEVRRLYVVHFADGLFHGEEPFFVLKLNDCLWVLPDDVEGINTLFGSIRERLEMEDGLYRARTPPRPFSWRRRIAGLLPLFPTPRLARHNLDTIPDWEEKGPLSITDLPEITGDLLL